jgi:hypothetical protein
MLSVDAQLHRGMSISIVLEGRWCSAFVTQMWGDRSSTPDEPDAAAGGVVVLEPMYVTLFYESTATYAAYVDYAEYDPRTNMVVFTTETGERMPCPWVQLDREVSFSCSELDLLMEQEMCDYDAEVKDSAWKEWESLTYTQKQRMVCGMSEFVRGFNDRVRVRNDSNTEA